MMWLLCDLWFSVFDIWRFKFFIRLVNHSLKQLPFEWNNSNNKNKPLDLFCCCNWVDFYSCFSKWKNTMNWVDPHTQPFPFLNCVFVHCAPRCRAARHNDGFRGQQQHFRRGQAASLYSWLGRSLLDRPHGLQCLAVLEEEKEEGTKQLCR